MAYFIALTLLQTVLFLELGLLFLRVLGRSKRRACSLGKPCFTLQCLFATLSRLVGYFFITFAAYVLAMGLLQLLALV